MLIQLDMESKDPLYTQLRNQIVEGIASNRLKPGDALPSVRSLAQDIGINLHTVNKAYKQLEHEGFLVIQRQKGALIHPDGVPQADDFYWMELSKALRPMIAEAKCRGIDEHQLTTLCQEIYQSFNKKGDSSS
ncbi:MAG TPA: GntR family transcriptional regulator [Cerasibacillus sp.]|uniref:GntR family transcriptional regulator n=1 Tax=Cerasibacillus sp. TaxID=2498711 RepID=UPI002F418915